MTADKSASQPAAPPRRVASPTNQAATEATSATSAALSSKDKADFLWKTIVRYDTYIGSTATRAGVITAVNAIVVGGIVLKYTEVTGGFQGHPNLKIIAGVLLVVAALTATASLYFVFAALVPSFGPGSSSGKDYSLIYFSDVSGQKKDVYIDDIRALADDRVCTDLAGQAYELSHIMREKFEKIRWAFRIIKWCLMPSLLALIFVKLLAVLFDIGKNQ